MSKTVITLDAKKLRNLVSKREFTNKDGQLMQIEEVKFELVPVKDPKTIYKGNGYDLVKTHFASVIQTKEEREAQAETIFIGEGITTVWYNSSSGSVFTATPVNEGDTVEDDSPDLPF